MVELFDHNQVALNNLMTTLRKTKRTSIIQPTGTGKSYVALGYIAQRPELRVAYLSPSTRIFDHVSLAVKDDPSVLDNVTFISYQKLHRMSDEEIKALHFDVIIFDEYHRCGAKLWQVAIWKLVANNPQTILIGLSATPIRYLDQRGVRDMTQELFNSSVAHQYTMAQAIADGNLPKPLYVLADIERKDILAAATARFNELKREGISSSFVSALQECLEEMRRNIQDAEGIEQVFEKYLPPHAKLIVFGRGYEHLKEIHKNMKGWLGSDEEIHSYFCRAKDLDYDADEQLRAFRNDNSPCIRLLYTVDMLNEGVHIDDLTGVVMLRPTASPNVYLQQLGRCLASGKNAAQQPIIFDLVNNYQRAKVKGDKKPVLETELGNPRVRGNGSNNIELFTFRIDETVISFDEVSQRFNNMTSNTRDQKWMEMFLRLKEEMEKKK